MTENQASVLIRQGEHRKLPLTTGERMIRFSVHFVRGASFGKSMPESITEPNPNVAENPSKTIFYTTKSTRVAQNQSVQIKGQNRFINGFCFCATYPELVPEGFLQFSLESGRMIASRSR
jgi:hypothetical protein